MGKKRLPGLTAAELAQVDLSLIAIGDTLVRLSRQLRDAYGESWLDKVLVEYRRIERLHREIGDKQAAEDHPSA